MSYKTRTIEDESANVEVPTSLMLKNLPCRAAQQDILDAIDALGFERDYDFFYMPMRPPFTKPQNYGYAFINFFSVERSLAFQMRLLERHVVIKHGIEHNKKMKWLPARLQGRESLVGHFKDTNAVKAIWGPMMRESPDEELRLVVQDEAPLTKAKKRDNGHSRYKKKPKVPQHHEKLAEGAVTAEELEGLRLLSAAIARLHQTQATPPEPSSLHNFLSTEPVSKPASRQLHKNTSDGNYSTRSTSSCSSFNDTIRHRAMDAFDREAMLLQHVHHMKEMYSTKLKPVPHEPLSVAVDLNFFGHPGSQKMFCL